MVNHKLALRLFPSVRILSFLACAVLIHACSDQSTTPVSSSQESVTPATTAPGPVLDENVAAAINALVTQYLARIDADFSAIQSELQGMQDEVNSFLQSPDAASLNRVRASWLRVHSAYELTAVHRYFAEVIAAEAARLELFQLQYQMNHWPVLPGYIDYVESYPESGIVNDMTVSLIEADVRAQHGAFDVNEAAIGFHALEFQIWGENRDRLSPRPFTDFEAVTVLTAEAEQRGLELEQLSNNRRREMLALNAEMLRQDFDSYMSIWAAEINSLRVELAETDSNELLVNLLEAMTSMLTEEILVRSLYPMLNDDFIDSFPSVFSHSSQNVVSAQLYGMEQLLVETSANSSTLDQILSSLSQDYGEFFLQNFDASKECLVLLYSTQDASPNPSSAADAEFAVVECINLLTNMVDYLEQIKASLSEPV